MNTKPIAVILTLVACLISCVISIVEGVRFGVFVERFAITALVFLALGTAITVFLNKGFQVDQEETEQQEDETEENGESPEDFQSEESDDEK